MTELDRIQLAFLLGAASGYGCARLDQQEGELDAEQQWIDEFDEFVSTLGKLHAQLDEQRLEATYLRGRRDALHELGVGDGGDETEPDPAARLN